MEKNKSTHESLTLPAEMVLDLICAEPSVASDYLSFYGAYIRAAATERIYTVEGCYCTTRFNDDLKQEIDIALFKSLAPLRRKLIQYLNDECAIVLIPANTL